jgi:hypothetical protein
LCAAEHAPLAAQEQLQHLQLDRGQVDARARAAKLSPGEIHFAVSESVNERAFRRGAPEQRPYACPELARTEGLRDVVVCAHIEAHHLLGLLCLRGEHQNGRADAGAPEIATDFEAILRGQHDVEQDEIPAGLAAATARLVAVCHDRHVVPFVLEVELETQGDVGLVFDD